MTAEELKLKYPQSIEMIDNLAGENNEHFFRPNRSVHGYEDGKYYYNYEGVHYRLFPSLEMLVKWFFGNNEEETEAENSIENFGYSKYLSNLKDTEVLLDVNNNVAFCDYQNSDFTKEQLEKAREEN